MTWRIPPPIGVIAICIAMIGVAIAVRDWDRVAPRSAPPAIETVICDEALAAARIDPRRLERLNACAQLRSAAAAERGIAWSWVQAMAGITGLLGLIVTLALTRRARAAAMEQARVARMPLEESERPLFFAKVDEVSSEVGLRVAEDSENERLRAPIDAVVEKVILTNVGTRPAFSVEVELAISLGQGERWLSRRFAQIGPGEEFRSRVSRSTCANNRRCTQARREAAD